MKSETERLRKRANRKNKIARSLLKKINRELSKPKSDLKRVLRWANQVCKTFKQGGRVNDKRQRSKATIEKSQTS